MNVIDIISNMYKKELADANHNKIIALAQCAVYEQRIKQLEKQFCVVAVITAFLGIWNDNSTKGLDGIKNKEVE